MILIFSIENDMSTASVVKWLKHFGQEVVVINSDNDNHKLQHINREGIFFKNTVTGVTVNLLDATSCWWRRSGLSIKNFMQTAPRKELVIGEHDLTEILTGSRSLIKSEVEDLRAYIFNKVYENCSINIGSPKLYGLNRLILLEIAQKHGFKVPEYDIITNLNQINSSSTIQDQFVSKAISDGIYHQINHKMYYSFTELHSKSAYEGQEQTVFPSLLMGLVEKKLEIRAFYLDGAFYSMAIFSQSSAQTKVDFRKYSDTKPNKTEPYTLPPPIAAQLKAVFDEVGLNCGSADLIVDTNGDFVFLEINPVGQYGMTSEPGNYNLDRLIAKYLIDGRNSN
jgi:ATP-GRASP peptide maturase of grasp-with-spasm system